MAIEPPSALAEWQATALRSETPTRLGVHFSAILAVPLLGRPGWPEIVAEIGVGIPDNGLCTLGSANSTTCGKAGSPLSLGDALMLTGWFTLHRDWLASEYWVETPFDRAHALMDLVGHARFKRGHVRLRGQRIDLERGQLAWSQKQLALRWGWSVNKVRRFLKELVSDKIVHVEGNRATTIITILNYDESFASGYVARANAKSGISKAHAATIETNPPTDLPSGEQANERARRGRQTKEQCQQRKQRQQPKEAVGVERDLPRKDSDSEDWQSLVESLRSFGVTGADAAIAVAQQRGVPQSEVRELLEEFGQGVPEEGGPPAWGPGALVARLAGTITCWPTPSKEHVRHQERRSQHRRDAVRHSDKAARMQKLDTERAEEADLQRRLGPVLEGMTDEDRQRLEERAIQNEQERTLSRRCKALHRIRLLRHLAEEACLAAA